MTTPPLLLPVVEGEGETFALPILLRRICGELLGAFDVQVRAPWRLPRGKMTKPAELQRVVAVLGTASRGRVGGLLVVLDQDDDGCPVTLADQVGRAAGTGTPPHVVVATREFEAWFLAAPESLRGHRSVGDDAAFGGDPESPRDAKGRLRQLMVEPYRETFHQAAFCATLDLERAAARSRSFRRLVPAVEALLATPAEPAK